ncbi:MAG TPA: class I adenylate-forming enzyme family protein [Polyangiaceae bacterium]|nr:class I adenylate-forming enzyme family protein [Polyangiaceae bacterium]
MKPGESPPSGSVPPASVASLTRRAATSTVKSLFRARVRQHPDALALEGSRGTLSYAALCDRVDRLAGVLAARGLGHGSRIAVLSENRPEYLEVFLAAATLGAVVACQNWRLSTPELRSCLELAEPHLAFVSPRFERAFADAGPSAPVVLFDSPYEAALAGTEPLADDPAIDGEDAFLMLYTSGTTGLPKAAVISHRAEIFRNLVLRAEFGIAATDTFVAWSPLYHMGGVDYSLSTLMSGGKVIVHDGFDAERLRELVEREPIGWLLLMPGMVASFADVLEKHASRPKGIKLCGVMADLVPPAQIARITRLLGAPYANTFGATETGNPPGSASPIPVGHVPTSLSKQPSAFCELRLVDSEDRDVAEGSPGELCVRGPTLFSGYFRADQANRHDFRGGWFHLGDVFVRRPDGTLDFVDRVKYLIKSGGENVYPAEIERVLFHDPRVAEAAVVRRNDAKWGEVPVAFVAPRDDTLTKEELFSRCRVELAGYKQPKDILFIGYDEFPRSASGKVLRHELEKRLAPGPPRS